MTTQTVLNVDDDAANRYLKSRALRQAGFQVIEATNAREALQLAGTRRPDLVLLDIQLPDISGLDVCRQLKDDPLTKDIPVVHISATFVDDAAKSSSVAAGAEVYLAEPVGPQELTSTIRTVMRLRAAELAVAENEQRLRLATEGAGIATWELGANGGAAAWSAQFRAMLGLEASAPATLETWAARVREDERALVQRALEDALSEVKPLSLEHWIVRADNGEERCIAAYGSAQRREHRPEHRMIGVAMDVTGRKRAEAERERLLEQARDGQRAAEEAARMKDEFLAILSHELRTPMSSVLGWLHLARRPGLAEAERDRALDVVERNARLQVQLVDDLLDVSRIVTGRLSVEQTRSPLDRVLAQAVETARLGAGTRAIELEGAATGGPWMVRGGEPRLAQIFGNLLSNAIKFSPEGSRIAVRLARDNGDAVVSVTDEGEGLAREALPRIFDVFRQADSSTRRRHGGLGLGLAIVKSLVDLHGGRIRAESPGRGGGASFIVTLPLADGPGAAPQSEPAGSEGESLANLAILLVDDEADHLEMTSSMLRMEGATVIAASSASEALDAVKVWRPDVMVLDIAMPETDGYQLLELLRKGLGAVPAVALTGFAAGSDAARAAAAGFQGHLAKPFRLETLRRLILKVRPT